MSTRPDRREGAGGGPRRGPNPSGRRSGPPSGGSGGGGERPPEGERPQGRKRRRGRGGGPRGPVQAPGQALGEGPREQPPAQAADAQAGGPLEPVEVRQPTAEAGEGEGPPSDESPEVVHAASLDSVRAPVSAVPPAPSRAEREAEVPARIASVVGVKFRQVGPIKECDSGAEVYQPGELVLVDTDRGPRVGRVVVGTLHAHSPDPLPRVLRRANAEEQRAQTAASVTERQAYLYCKQRVRERKLSMKLIQAEIPPGGQKAVFYFASEDRIDFRDLVRDLAQHLRLRIEMRQLGVRDEAKLVGGIGDCGRELCCTTWLPAFMPVSIKMAKDQGMVLNPAKLSGQCGRLKCCLVYEHDTYKEMSKGLPKVGKRVHTPAGPGKAIEVDVLAQKVRVLFDEGGVEVFPANVVTPQSPPSAASEATPSGLTPSEK